MAGELGARMLPATAEALAAEDRQYLLRLARASAAEALGGPEAALPAPISPRLLARGACFVTFLRRGVPPGLGLRGCLGSLEISDPLWLAVQRMAGEAVTNDPRFWGNPVTLEELPSLHIDVSVLYPRRLLSDPLSLELGLDGIVVEGQGPYAHQRGVYLPQVATEHHMTKEEFLSSCCSHKAGLPAEGWRNPAVAQVYGFRAEVIQEE